VLLYSVLREAKSLVIGDE